MRERGLRAGPDAPRSAADDAGVMNGQPTPTVETDDPARAAAIASLKRKRKFAQDATAYVAVNGVLWLIWVLTDRSSDGSIPWPAWVSMAWGFFLLLDAWRAYALWPGNRPITDTEIERELRRIRHA